MWLGEGVCIMGVARSAIMEEVRLGVVKEEVDGWWMGDRGTVSGEKVWLRCG